MNYTLKQNLEYLRNMVDGDMHVCPKGWSPYKALYQLDKINTFLEREGQSIRWALELAILELDDEEELEEAEETNVAYDRLSLELGFNWY